MPSVRRATVDDLPALIELMREFYAESGFPLDSVWAAEAFGELIGDPSLGAVWLLLVDDQVAGHVVLTVRFAMEFGGTSAIIDDLFVRPGHRRRGLARAGLEALLAECRRRNCRSIEVEVDPSNVPAGALYRSLGLTEGTDARLHLRARL